MARLFISYARKDGREFSESLSRDLSARGHENWLDRSALTGGMDWTREIESGIEGSDAVLAVITESYHESRVAGMELVRAFRKDKPLIPLRVFANAEIPLLLETAQYEDFTDTGRYQASLLSLLHTLEALPGGAPGSRRPTGPAGPEPVAARAGGWETVRTGTRRQAERFIRERQGTAKHPGSFIPELYVRRQVVEDALDSFLAGSASGLILIGDTGVGKTNLLCHWMLALQERNHAVLAYDCGALIDTDIEREIARDLGAGDGRDVPALLEDMSAKALAEASRLIVVFDAINDYPGAEQGGVNILLRRINALVARLSGVGVRFVVSCSTTWWERQTRFGPIHVDRTRYFCSDDGEPLIHLEAFTPEEFEMAYPQYQRFFTLSTPLDELTPALRKRLREPVLLRMIAEAHRGLKQPLTSVNLALGIYRRFFEERVRLNRDVLFVEELAGEMLKRKSGSLPISDLARHERLGPEILNEDASSTYCRLLDRGVLREAHADVRVGTTIQFAYPRVGAYALASYMRKQSSDDAQMIRSMVEQSSQFPLAWDTAKTLLLLSKAEAIFVALAESPDLDRRELAAEALVELSADEPETARTLLERLMDRKSETSRRTALKAAHKIGPQARSLFLRAALDGDPAVRHSVRDTLYLIWRTESAAAQRKTVDTLYLIWRDAPGFTYEFLNDLAAQIRPINLLKLRTILEFVLDLSITIYINHCEQPEVIDRTARLYHDLATRRLRLDLLNTGFLGAGFEKQVFRAVARVFSKRILSWMLFGDGKAAEAFFAIPLERRACLARIAGALDPSSNLESARDDLAGMLQSGTPIFSGAAALVIAVHAYRDFRAVEPLIRRFFEELNPTGRLWLLLGFSILLPDTPSEWVPLIEDFTTRYVAGDLESFRKPPKGLMADFDIALLPLGLAYGKTGGAMPFFETLIRDARSRGDTTLVARVVSALGPVGFYFPLATFELFRMSISGLGEGVIQDAMASALATIRTLHFDAVDRFLDQLDAPEQFRRRVDAAADVERVHQYIHALGYYNNAVHYTLNYPRMRRRLAMGALKLLADARDANQFVADYTAEAVRMFREAEFQLLEWTRAD